MQWTLSGVKPRHPIHLTLRGPYRREVPPEVMEKLWETLQGEELDIGGVGRFRNRHEEVVFLGVDSPSLRKVWWKRDYPIKTYGYRPHISLYRGRDAQFADHVFKFLKKEEKKLDLKCDKHKLIVYKKQPLPLEKETGALDEETGALDEETGALLKRLRRLVDEYHQKNAVVVQNDVRFSETGLGKAGGGEGRPG